MRTERTVVVVFRLLSIVGWESWLSRLGGILCRVAKAEGGSTCGDPAPPSVVGSVVVCFGKMIPGCAVGVVAKFHSAE